MFIIIAAIATFINFAIIIWKFSSGRHLDAAIDVSVFAIICYLFQSTITGLQIGMIASMMMSIYLIFAIRKVKL